MAALTYSRLHLASALHLGTVAARVAGAQRTMIVLHTDERGSLTIRCGSTAGHSTAQAHPRSAGAPLPLPLIELTVTDLDRLREAVATADRQGEPVTLALEGSHLIVGPDEPARIPTRRVPPYAPVAESPRPGGHSAPLPKSLRLDAAVLADLHACPQPFPALTLHAVANLPHWIEWTAGPYAHGRMRPAPQR